jgi:N-acetylglucosamine kinase-like BadF-type ATPase
LGVRALGLALRATDGRGEPTLLSSRVPAHFDLTDAEAVLTAVYTGALHYDRLFELAPVLLDAATDGDAPSRRAADTLADEVATIARAAITRLGVADTTVEVVLGGGIFDTKYADFHARVAEGIHALAPRALLRRLAAPPVLGAALLGLDALGADEESKQRLRLTLTKAEDDGTYGIG